MTWDQHSGDDDDRRSDRQSDFEDPATGGTSAAVEGGGSTVEGSEQGARVDADDEIVLGFIPLLGGNGDDDSGDDDDAACFARYYEAILRFFRTKVPSNAVVEAEDLAITVFKRLIERRRKGPLVDKQGRLYNIKGFLYGIAFNVLKEHLREVTKRSRIEDIGKMSIATISRTLSSQAAHDQMLNQIHHDLRCLPFYEQLVIECCTYHAMSFKDVAALLKVPLGTVATYSHRARRRLRERIKARDSRPPAGADDDERIRKELLAAYPWYDPATGRIDVPSLIACATKNRCEIVSSSPPRWVLDLELPTELPLAAVEDLWNLVYSVWKAWEAASSSSEE